MEAENDEPSGKHGPLKAYAGIAATLATAVVGFSTAYKTCIDAHQDTAGTSYSTKEDDQTTVRPPEPVPRRFANAEEAWRAGREQRELNSQAAMESFREAVRIDPSYAPAYNSIGTLKRDTEGDAKAVGWYAQALDHDSNYFPAMTNLAWAHYRLGNIALARTWLERSLALNPTGPEANELQRKLAETP